MATTTILAYEINFFKTLFSAQTCFFAYSIWVVGFVINHTKLVYIKWLFASCIGIYKYTTSSLATKCTNQNLYNTGSVYSSGILCVLF